MQITVNGTQAGALLAAAPSLMNGPILYTLDGTNTYVLAAMSVNDPSSSLLVLMPSNVVTLTAFEAALPGRTLVQVTALAD